MTLSETRFLLTWLWGLFPNAPKLSSNERKIMATSYFWALHKFSLQDVMRAADEQMRSKPSYVPTAYEIQTRCQKSYDSFAFLSQEYFSLKNDLGTLEKKLDDAGEKLEESRKKYKKSSMKIDYILHKNEYEKVKKEIDEHKKLYDAAEKDYENALNDYIYTQNRIQELMKQAQENAIRNYDQQQIMLAEPDLKIFQTNETMTALSQGE